MKKNFSKAVLVYQNLKPSKPNLNCLFTICLSFYISELFRTDPLIFLILKISFHIFAQRCQSATYIYLEVTQKKVRKTSNTTTIINFFSSDRNEIIFSLFFGYEII